MHHRLENGLEIILLQEWIENLKFQNLNSVQLVILQPHGVPLIIYINFFLI